MRSPATYRVLGATCPYDGCSEGIARTEGLVEGLCAGGHCCHVRWLNEEEFILEPLPGTVPSTPAGPPPGSRTWQVTHSEPLWVRSGRAVALVLAFALSAGIVGWAIAAVMLALLEAITSAR